jgi:hypothetical protein
MDMTPRELALRKALAMRDAPRLRREAIAAFWADVAAGLGRLWHRPAAAPHRTARA